MAAKDIFHKVVKAALIKEEWSITDNPLFIQFGGVELRIYLWAERVVAAEKEIRSLLKSKVSLGLPSSLIFTLHLDNFSIIAWP